MKISRHTLTQEKCLFLDLSNKKNSIKRHFGNEESESEEGKPLNSNTWASNEKFFSSFKDNFFDTELSGGSFGDWKSRIEDRSNRVLQGYDSHSFENSKYSTGEVHNSLYHCLSTFIFKNVLDILNV